LRFTVRRLASAEVSPCCHRRSGGEVACSVHVGVARRPGAGFALENRLALAVLARDMPARGASLRRVRGRDLLDATESLVLQTRSEQTPTVSSDSSVQTAFLSYPHTRLRHRSPCTAGHRTHVAEAHPADLGHPHPTEPAIQTLDMMRFHRDLPESLMHTGFAPRRAAVGSAEKVAHRLGEVSQRLLLHRLRPGRQPVVLGAGRGQLSTLLAVAGCAATGLPVPLLLDGQVPHIPGVATMLRQHSPLLSGRKQPVTRHTGNVNNATDKSPKGEAALPPPTEARGFHAATTR
jgi:hypothetical protein